MFESFAVTVFMNDGFWFLQLVEVPVVELERLQDDQEQACLIVEHALTEFYLTSGIQLDFDNVEDVDIEPADDLLDVL